jgi:hypothetical protein
MPGPRTEASSVDFREGYRTPKYVEIQPRQAVWVRRAAFTVTGLAIIIPRRLALPILRIRYEALNY